MLLQVRTKTFVAVGHESANNVTTKDHMKANLLANMELGVHAPQGGEIQLQTTATRSDDPEYGMRATGDSDDEFYSRSPVQVWLLPPLVQKLLNMHTEIDNSISASNLG